MEKKNKKEKYTKILKNELFYYQNLLFIVIFFFLFFLEANQPQLFERPANYRFEYMLFTRTDKLYKLPLFSPFK